VTANALDRHIVLIGFMGAGKTRLGREAAALLGRPFLDLDASIEERTGSSIPELFDRQGERAFRVLEEEAAAAALASRRPALLSFGGGAVSWPATRELLADAFVVGVDVDVDSAWVRVGRSRRPNARDETAFRALHAERAPLYRSLADAFAVDATGIVLSAAGIAHGAGGLDRLGELVPGDGPLALLADANVLRLYGPRARQALGPRLAGVHELPVGEEAKSAEVAAGLWSALSLEREGTVVALGGGCTTDLAGFVAASYLRGVPWVAVPTTLVGQIDAAIGGKTGIDIPGGKNLVGAFHWPLRVVIDETLLESLPPRERRQGMAELVKTRLLAGSELDQRAAAAFKAALCLEDPFDRGRRRLLNLGHTFAHGLEAAADFELPHGEAVALGLLAALRLSGRDTAAVERELAPERVRVDPERAWQALLRDKKRSGGAINLVLLGDEGPFVAERPAAEVRQALEALIAEPSLSRAL
jgi:shikimate kinase/3-dehydroquinate synthase